MPSLREAFMAPQPGYGWGPPPPMGPPMGGYMPAYGYAPMPMRPMPPPMYMDYGYASCGYGGYGGDMYGMGYEYMPRHGGMRQRSSSLGPRGRYEEDDEFDYPSRDPYIRAADREPARYEMPDLKKLKPKVKKSYDTGNPGFVDMDPPKSYRSRNQRGPDGPEYKVTKAGTALPSSKADLLPAMSIEEWEQRRHEDRLERNVDITQVPQLRRRARQIATDVSKYHPDFHEPRKFGDRHVSKLIMKHPDMNEQDILEHYVGKLQLELNEIGDKYDPCNDAPEIQLREREKPEKIAHRKERLAITYPEDDYLNGMDNLGIKCLSHYKGTRTAANTDVLAPRQFIRDTQQVLPETYASKYESTIPPLAEPVNKDCNSTDKKPFLPYYYGLTNRRIDTDEDKALAINYTYEDRRKKTAMDVYDHDKKDFSIDAPEKPLDSVGATNTIYVEPSKKKPSRFYKPKEESSVGDTQLSEKSAFVTEPTSLSKFSPAKEINPPVMSSKNMSEVNHDPPSVTADDLTSPTISLTEDPEKEKKRLEKKKRKAEREQASRQAMEAELAALAAAEAELRRLEKQEKELKS